MARIVPELFGAASALLTSTSQPLQPKHQQYPTQSQKNSQKQLWILTADLGKTSRQEIGLQQRHLLPMAVGMPGEGFFPWPEFVQRAEHQPRQQGQGQIAPTHQQPTQQPGEADDANQATAGKQHQHVDIQTFHRPENEGIQTQQQQDEAAGNTRQDHRADGNRTGKENTQRISTPLHWRGHRDPVGKSRPHDETDEPAPVPTLDFARHQMGRNQNQAEKERPHRERMHGQQEGDQPRQTKHTGQNARQQNQQEGRVGSLPGGEETTAQEHAQSSGHTGDRTQQLIVDTADKGYGAAGNARHHIGRTHGNAFGEEQDMFIHGYFQANAKDQAKGPLSKGTKRTESSTCLANPCSSRTISSSCCTSPAPTGITSRPPGAN